MRAAALGNACGARAATVPVTVAAAPLPSASASPLSIGVAARGGVATSRAGFSAASSRSSRGARRSSAVLRAVEGGSISSVSLGPSASSSSAASAAPSASGGGVGGSKATVVLPLDQVDLTSEAGIDWTKLRDLLASGDLRAADDEHRARLIELAGPAAVERNWVYFSEVKTMPARDLRVMDALWRAASNGKYGFSAQREVWLSNRKRWDKFFKAIDWVQGEFNVYRKWPGEFNYDSPTTEPKSAAAPKGHLPLTNALRGTQLFQAILEHPAWDEAPQGVEGKSGGSKGPEWLK